MLIQEYLKAGRLITDGAMGTYYEEKYGKAQEMSEQANETHPQRVREVHLDYLRSGARLIRTNTFATNSMFFASMEEIVQNIKKGYAIASEAVQIYQQENPADQIIIAADIGTIYDSNHLEYESVLAEYKKICDTFLECGASCFVFETQADFTYIEPVSQYLKEKSEAFIIVQFSFDKSGYTRAGISVDKMVRTASAMDSIDAYGFNCGVEATHMYQLLKGLAFPSDKYITVLPNAGYPYTLRGKTIYSHNVGYYVEEMKKIAALGIEIMGGCCGTTPAHIEALQQELQAMPLIPKRVGVVQSTSIRQRESEFERKLDAGEKAYIVELDPPFQTDVTKVMDGAAELAQVGVDMITLSDSPMARTRMDAGQLAIKMQQETGVPVMPHICCRDKNVIALRAGMLGTYMNGIRHYLIVTGDPVGRGDRERVTSVFDFNSIKFMRYVNEMNDDAFAGEPVVYGGALNYHGANVGAIIDRMKLKIEAGCSCFLTQPVYTAEDVERIRYIKEHVDTRILCGIMPLVSYKNAMFVKNEMPGIHISDDIVSRYREDMTREEAEAVARDISAEIAGQLYDVVDGFYFMTPFNRTGLICGIIEAIRALHKEEN